MAEEKCFILRHEHTGLARPRFRVTAQPHVARLLTSATWRARPFRCMRYEHSLPESLQAELLYRLRPIVTNEFAQKKRDERVTCT